MERVKAMLYQLSHNLDFSVAPRVLMSYKMIFLIMLFGYITHWWPTRWKDNYMNWFIRTPHWAKVIIVAVLVFIIYQAQTTDLQPFIYFQF